MAHEVTELERCRLIEESETVYINSKFEFLKEIKGIRPEKFHLILSTTGAGKSTLIKSLLRELLTKVKVHLWLTEESIKDLNLSIARGAFTELMLKNLTVDSEESDELKPIKGRALLDYFENRVRETKAHVVLLDNISTSSFYMNERPDAQGEIAKRIKFIGQSTGAAMVVVTHTDGTLNEVNQNLISENNVRGGKTISNLAEFMFAIQRLKVKEDIFTFVRILKCRSLSIDNRIFQMAYEKNTGLYGKDFTVDWDTFKEVYNARNQLGGKK